MKHSDIKAHLASALKDMKSARQQLTIVQSYYAHITFELHTEVKALVHDLNYGRNVLEHLEEDLDKLELINVDNNEERRRTKHGLDLK